MLRFAVAITCIGVAAAAAAALSAQAQAQTYTNPVVKVQTPDPGVIYSNGQYYAVTTSGDDADSFPIRTSTDLVNWKQVGFVFPHEYVSYPLRTN